MTKSMISSFNALLSLCIILLLYITIAFCSEAPRCTSTSRGGKYDYKALPIPPDAHENNDINAYTHISTNTDHLDSTDITKVQTLDRSKGIYRVDTPQRNKELPPIPTRSGSPFLIPRKPVMSHKLRDISNPNKDPYTASSKVNDIEPLRRKDTSSSLPAYAVTDTEGERSADYFGTEFRPITAYETLHLRSAESFDLSEIGSEDKSENGTMLTIANAERLSRTQRLQGLLENLSRFSKRKVVSSSSDENTVYGRNNFASSGKVWFAQPSTLGAPSRPSLLINCSKEFGVTRE